jgi:hypothetical protein
MRCIECRRSSNNSAELLTEDVEGESQWAFSSPRFGSDGFAQAIRRKSGWAHLYRELGPFDALETGAAAMDTLWVRGGFPRSFLAGTDDLSTQWRRDFVQLTWSAIFLNLDDAYWLRRFDASGRCWHITRGRF